MDSEMEEKAHALCVPFCMVSTVYFVALGNMYIMSEV